MKNCYIESVIYEIAQKLKTLAQRSVITKDRKIILYGLDTYSFAMRTVLSNMGYETDSYISDDPELLIRYKRHIKAFRARHLNGERDLIGICSVGERLQFFDETALILSGSPDCPGDRIEGLGYARDHAFFQVYDWRQDRFDVSMQGKRRAELKEIQSMEKDMLYQIDQFCLKRGLRYWVCGGTLLGTIRHKGFIPWDDDIDLFMPWKDYRALIEEFTCHEPYHMIVPDRIDRKDYYDYFTKMVDERIAVRENLGYLRKVHPLSIDIFPLLGMPADEDERKLFFAEFAELDKKIWEDFYAHDGDLGVFNQWYSRQEGFLARYDFDRSDYAGVLGTAYGERDCTTKEVYDFTLRMPFEDIEVNVAGGYREYLDNLYGADWMEIPEENKRASHHHMEAYWV